MSLPQITTFYRYSAYLSNLSFQNYVRFYFINCQTFEVIRTQHESEGISPTGGDSLGEVPPLPLPGCLHLMGGQVTILLQLLVQVLRNVMYTKTELVESDQDANKPWWSTQYHRPFLNRKLPHRVIILHNKIFAWDCFLPVTNSNIILLCVQYMYHILASWADDTFQRLYNTNLQCDPGNDIQWVNNISQGFAHFTSMSIS